MFIAIPIIAGAIGAAATAFTMIPVAKKAFKLTTEEPKESSTTPSEDFAHEINSEY